jgi:predicted transcriptional regulator of viral defense system
MSATEKILQKFKQNRGFIAIEDKEANIRYALKKMQDNQEITRLKKGVYVLNNQEEYDERVLIAKMYPKAVFCLFSAWEYYELTTSLPTAHSIALGRNTKISIPKFPPIKVHYWSGEAYQLGITEVTISNKKVKMYDLEKSVCDAIKHRGKIGENITIEIIKNYITRKDKNLDKLMQYATQLRILKTTEQYIKPLL